MPGAQVPESDNLISMRDISATDASRNFSELLDAVEHGGESFTISRHGKVVARLDPAGGNGAAVRALLTDAHPDRAWAADLEEIRSLPAQEREWNG
jgi:prevent-host-death family protein